MKVTSILLILTLSLGNFIAAQELQDFNRQRKKHIVNSMIALNTWALGNIAVGTTGYFLSEDTEWKYFHEMNVYWNIVNLGIAVPSYLISRKENIDDIDFRESILLQHKVESSYLVNSALDIAYISSGFFMRHIGKQNDIQSKKNKRLRGYGTSLILQGTYLLTYDVVAYILHKRNASKLDPLWNRIQVKPRGIGLELRYTIN